MARVMQPAAPAAPTGGALGAGRRVAASSAILIVESTLRIGLTALVSFWIARHLGPSGFGVLNAAMALTWIFFVVACLGLEVPAVLRLTTARDDAERSRLLATALLLRVAAAVPAIAAAVLIALLLHRGDAQALSVSLIVTLAIAGYAPSVLDVWFRSRTQALAPACARLAATLTAAAVKLWILVHGADIVLLAWAAVFEACLLSLLMAAMFWRSSDRPRAAWRWDGTLARDLLRQSVPLLMAGIVLMIYSKSDVVLLAALTDHAQTGLFALAQKLSEVLYVVPVAIVDSLFPLLAARLKPLAADAVSAADSDQLMFDLAAAAAIGVTLTGLVLAAPLVRLFFGDAYAPTIGLFAIHAWTCVPVALDFARHRWLVAVGLQKRAPWLAGCGALVAVGLNLALVPVLGAVGAAWTALAACTVSGVVSSFLWPDLRAVGRMQCRALWPWARLMRQAQALLQRRARAAAA
jgi:O-antigen/teichoic acid export membrane protein